MAEYRLEELARLSGVSARNIRAYRERGLLGAPRREGRSAYYSDAHVAQLETIDRLLRRGFNSAHISEFFATVRAGRDLADVLGVHYEVVGDGPGSVAAEAGGGPPRQPILLDIDAAGDEARRLLGYGLAERVPEGIALTDPQLAAIVHRSATSQLGYVRVVLQVYESARGTIDDLAAAVGDALQTQGATERDRDDVAEVDYRALVTRVVAWCVDEVLSRRLGAAADDRAETVTKRPRRSSD